MTRQNISPWQSLIWLILLVFAGAIAGSILSVLIVLVFNSFDLMALLPQISSVDMGDLHSIRIIQAGSSLGMFLAPPLLLGIFEGDRFKYFPLKVSMKGQLLVLTLLAMIALQPIIQILAVWNLGMELPESFRSIEIWMETQEKASEKLVLALLSDVSPLGFVSNLLVIAVVAAFAEEALFRGGLQKLFTIITRNPHFAIWMVAFIFSAIHLQFYGFLPRLFMGAFFGYLMLWTKNIMYPILAHLLNNGAAVVQAFFMVKEEGDLSNINEIEIFPVYVYIFAVILSGILIYFIFKRTNERVVDHTT